MSAVLKPSTTTVAKRNYGPFNLHGVMQAPVTPLKDDFSFDGDGFAKMVDFHVRHKAPAIAWPHHKAESLNLTMAERKLGAEIAVKTINKRVPLSIFVGTLSEEDSLDLARHAQKIGADMILTISPYCRRPSQEEIFDSIVRIGTHTDLPVLTYNSPWRNGEGVEHLLAAFPLGACGSFSSSGAIAPNLCNKFFAAMEAEDWKTAKECQFTILQMYRMFKEQYPSSLKGAMINMGRPVGPTRPPLPTATKERVEFLRAQLDKLGVLQTEPHGW